MKNWVAEGIASDVIDFSTHCLFVMHKGANNYLEMQIIHFYVENIAAQSIVEVIYIKLVVPVVNM